MREKITLILIISGYLLLFLGIGCLIVGKMWSHSLFNTPYLLGMCSFVLSAMCFWVALKL